jgi:hypothetical protein
VSTTAGTFFPALIDAADARTVYAMALDLLRRKLSEGDLSQIQGFTETRH